MFSVAIRASAARAQGSTLSRTLASKSGRLRKNGSSSDPTPTPSSSSPSEPSKADLRDIPPTAPPTPPSPSLEAPLTEGSSSSSTTVTPEEASIAESPSLSLDFAPQERTRARAAKDSMSSSEKSRRNMARFLVVSSALGLLAGGFYLGRDWEPGEVGEGGRWTRTKRRALELGDVFSKPLWKELLPPPLPPSHQKPLTLLLSLDDLLIGSAWDREHGWRTAKRPGVDYFLAYLSQFYEVVVFTSQYHYTALPILEALDPFTYFITYKLFREATRSVGGEIVKDLSYLNRDLGKVVILDAHADHVRLHPENAIVMKPWHGDPKDQELVSMIPFLESLAIYKPADVREVLKAYGGKDIPTEYAKVEAAQRKAHEDQYLSTKHGSASKLTLSSLFLAPNPVQAEAAKRSKIPPTYLEQRRMEAQHLYREEQKYLKEHEEEFRRLIQQDRDAAAKEMSGSLFGAMFGKPPTEAGKEVGRTLSSKDVK